ncbi:MAG: DNA-protecting protein DprA [Bacteroidetes bacterium]|nr:DNA-protecting protein DprA [Bacteroidota bacterium]
MNKYIQEYIALTMIEGVGSMTIQYLLSYCGGIENIFRSSKAKLMKIPNIGAITADAILSKDPMDRAEEELQFIEKNQIQTYFHTDENYPHRLKECKDHPLLMFYKGNSPIENKKVLAIVGTRNATEYSQRFLDTLLEELSTIPELLVVSGLAYGVDIKSHRACIKNKIPNIAVMGTGLNSIYPATHRKYAVEIVQNGGLLTEFTTRSKIVPANFPMRNRIIAGLSDVTLVVETKTKGGSVITANIANSYNREVVALPGKVGEETSEGCNFLIKTYKAQMVESAADLLNYMDWGNTLKKKKAVQREFNFEGNDQEKKVYEIIQNNRGIEIDKLCYLSELTGSAIAGILLEMELNNIVRPLPGKKYELI